MTSVRLQRTINAPPERVYRAWLDPGLLAQWMAPGRLTVTKAEVDARPGGHYRIFHTDSAGFDATIVEMDEPARLVFRWAFVGPERLDGPHFDSLLTVTFAPAPGDATLLTLVHEKLDGLAAAMPEVAAGVSPGWADALGKLAEVSL